MPKCKQTTVKVNKQNLTRQQYSFPRNTLLLKYWLKNHDQFLRIWWVILWLGQDNSKQNLPSIICPNHVIKQLETTKITWKQCIYIYIIIKFNRIRLTIGWMWADFVSTFTACVNVSFRSSTFETLVSSSEIWNTTLQKYI